MAIKLRVISDQYQELGEHRSRVFGVNGGTIGRAPDNDWILPDAKRLVSGHHCDIEYRSGAYWLSDKSTNGVFVNEADDPVSETGPVALQDGDRLRLGDYEILVSLDDRIDFLPAASELHSAAKHLDADIGANLDLDSLFTPRESADSGSISIRNAFGLKLPKDLREAAAAAVARAEAANSSDEREPPTPPPSVPAAAVPPAATDWALKTRAVTRQELADALERRRSRIEARQQTLPFHQQASSWTDLKSSMQAFCRGAGIDPTALSPEAQAMLPLLAGQLLREAVVGLNDLQQARTTTGPAASSAAKAQEAPGQQPAAQFLERGAGPGAAVRVSWPGLRRPGRRAAGRAARGQGARGGPRCRDAGRPQGRARPAGSHRTSPTSSSRVAPGRSRRARTPGRDTGNTTQNSIA